MALDYDSKEHSARIESE